MESVNSHLFAVVFWIGGVAFVTTILIPALKQIPDINNRMELFEKLEGHYLAVVYYGIVCI